MNKWSCAEFFSVVPVWSNGFIYYGGPFLCVKVNLMTKLCSCWQSWQIHVNFKIVSDQVSDNNRKKNELTRTNFFLMAITNR